MTTFYMGFKEPPPLTVADMAGLGLCVIWPVALTDDFKERIVSGDITEQETELLACMSFGGKRRTLEEIRAAILRERE